LDRDRSVSCEWVGTGCERCESRTGAGRNRYERGTTKIDAGPVCEGQAAGQCTAIIGNCARRIERACECAQVEWAIR